MSIFAKRVFIVCVVVLVMVILLSLCCCMPAYVPYSKGESYALYEGMDERETSGGNTAASYGSVQAAGGSDVVLENSSLPINTVSETFSPMNLFLGGNVSSGNASVKTEGFVSPSLSPSLSPSFLDGLGGLFPSSAGAIYDSLPGGKNTYPSNTDSSEKLDRFLDVTKVGVNGKDGCQSSGLSNSRGELCLPPELIKMLQTRGGNA
jgi:hypothetical protein